MLLHYVASYAVSGTIFLGIAVFALLKQRGESTSRIFFFYFLSVAWWCLLSIPAILALDPSVGLAWCRVFIVGAIFVPTLYFHDSGSRCFFLEQVAPPRKFAPQNLAAPPGMGRVQGAVSFREWGFNIHPRAPIPRRSFGFSRLA